MVRFLTQDIFSVFFSPLLGLLLYVYTESIRRRITWKRQSSYTHTFIQFQQQQQQWAPKCCCHSVKKKRNLFSFFGGLRVELNTDDLRSSNGGKGYFICITILPPFTPKISFSCKHEVTPHHGGPFWATNGIEIDMSCMNGHPVFANFLFMEHYQTSPIVVCCCSPRGRSWSDLWK